MFKYFTKRDQGIIRSLIRKLPSMQREAVTLHYWKNYDVSEVARELEISCCEANAFLNNGIDEVKRNFLELAVLDEERETHVS
jgi:DNA-directed RNA polymerase specialized sigma24 family protein